MALYGSGTAGRVALLKTQSTTNQACTAMICKSKARAFYLFNILALKYKEIDSLTRGSVQQNLSKDIVSEFMVEFPGDSFLEKYHFEDIYESIANNTKENIKLEQLRDTLLPKLMSGEIDISEIKLGS